MSVLTGGGSRANCSLRGPLEPSTKNGKCAEWRSGATGSAVSPRSECLKKGAGAPFFRHAERVSDTRMLSCIIGSRMGYIFCTVNVFES